MASEFAAAAAAVALENEQFDLVVAAESVVTAAVAHLTALVSAMCLPLVVAVLGHHRW